MLEISTLAEEVLVPEGFSSKETVPDLSRAIETFRRYNVRVGVFQQSWWGSDVKEHNQMMSQNIIKLLLSTVLPVQYGRDL